MNFGILCTSFEAPTYIALSDKTNRMKIGQEMWEKQFCYFWNKFA